MAKYIDGFLIPVKKEKLDRYKEMAVIANRVWRKHGALDYMECVGDDLMSCAEWGGLPFPKLMELADDEVAIFAFITYKSKEDRDRVNQLVMEDPEMKDQCGEGKEEDMPFDMKKMATGGFEVIVN